MNSEIILNDYLLNLKSTTEVYVHGTLESSNENVRKVLHDSLCTILDSQRNCYCLMVENGIYTINNVKCSDIKKLYNKENK